jgi:hypothetical protein
LIPSQEEIKTALEGALLLARGNVAGMTRFDLSTDQYAATEVGAHIVGVVTIEALAYVIGWCAFPVAAIFLTRLLGLGARYVPLVVAINWCGVLQLLVLAAAVLLGGLAPPAGRGMLGLVALLAVLTYQWFVIRTALETTSGTAAGLLVVDLLLSLLVHEAAGTLIQSV